MNFCTVNKTAARCSRPMHNHKPRAGCMIAYIAFTSSQPATSSLLNYIQTATSGCDSACILTSCQPARRQTAIHDCQRARSATYSLPPSHLDDRRGGRENCTTLKGFPQPTRLYSLVARLKRLEERYQTQKVSEQSAEFRPDVSEQSKGRPCVRCETSSRSISRNPTCG